MVKTYIPAGRKVREFWVALADPDPANPMFPADGEMSAFLRLTTAKPIRLLIVLHEQGQANIAPCYFSLDRFDSPVRYDKHDEDSDAVVRNAAGVRQRCLPNADHTFEQWIYKLCYQEKRQSGTKKYVKGQHKDKYSDTIHSDDENFAYIVYLRGPDVNSGHRLVLARQVVSCPRRAWHLNRAFGISNLRSLARSLKAAQYRWEDLQPGAPGHPGPAPPAAAAPQPNVPPALQDNVQRPRANRGKRPRTHA